MTGLVGFVKDTTSENATELLNKMVHALESEQERFHIDTFSSGCFGIGCLNHKFENPQNQIAWNQSKTVCLSFLGEIYNSKELMVELSSHGYNKPVQNTSELFLSLYEIFDETFVSKINGAFLVIIWDQQKKELKIINDRLGLYPIYYALVSDGLIYSTGVRSLLVDPKLDRSINFTSIAQFITFDHLLDHQTLLSSVQLMSQGSILTYTQSNINIRKYWDFKYPRFYKHRSLQDYIEELVDTLENAVRRQSPDGIPAGLLLSGGLDSRFLLALLTKINHSETLHTFTWGIPNCDDAKIAQELAKKTRTQHHFFELKPDYLLHKASEAVRLTDGMANIINLHALATLDEEAEYAQIIYKGFLGDAMMGFALQPAFWADYDEDTSEAVHLSIHNYQGVYYFDRNEQRKLFTDSFEKTVGNSVFETYREGMNRADHNQLAVQRLYFDYTQRVPRHTLNGVKVVRSRAQVRLPFADNDLVDFSLIVPPGYHYKRQLIRLAFINAFPYLAKTPVSDTGLPMVSCSRDLILRTKQLVKWHVNNRLGNKIHWPTRQPYKDYNNWFRTILRPWVEKLLLSNECLERGYFRPEYLQNLISDHMLGKDNTVKLGAMLSLELWHKENID
jgi:asparagine synthase (glutamine-hydrolysing)